MDIIFLKSLELKSNLSSHKHCTSKPFIGNLLKGKMINAVSQKGLSEIFQK